MQIDVYQDTVCPWCRIGKRNLELALEDWNGEPVTVQYHSFYLDPNVPPEGYDFRPYMEAKGGGRVPLQAFFDAPRERGEAVGLDFNFEDITRAPNTKLSHQLVAIAPEDKRLEILDAITAAYFEEGQDIGELDTLVEIAAGAGLDADEVRKKLLAGEGQDEVEEDIATARRLGISGVPFFVINNQYGFSGAQPPEMIRRVLNQAAAESVK